MTRFMAGGLALGAVLASGAAGYRLGGGGRAPAPVVAAAVVTAAPAERKALYYRDPDGKPDVSPTAKTTAAGRAYVAVYDDKELSVPDAAPLAPKGSGKVKFYRNPMGLPDTSPTPKKDQMGMDYIPVLEGETEDGDRIEVSPGKIQRSGVETVVIGMRAITRTIKAPGVVTYDERRISVVAPRFDGFVETVGPATTGTHVRQGDVLATVFGQELLAQASRLIVEQGWSGNEGATLPGSKNQAAGAVGARRRLLNMGAPEEFIAQIAREKRVPDTLTIRAPRDGVVIERNIVDGQGFKAGDVAFRIADHSAVWVMADVAEGDLDAIQPGQAVKVTARARPGRTFDGAVTLISPHLMKETRTARIRIELSNPDFALLPDMYADVEISTGSAERVIAVPASSVIDNGARQVVLRDLGNGRFEPREVKPGRRGDGFVEVMDGVREGDKVVVNGNFLIDAESNLQSALKGFTPPQAAEARP